MFECLNKYTCCVLLYNNVNVIMLDTLSHSLNLHIKILHELNHNGLCLYNNTQQVYLFKHSNKIVNCPYILEFLKQSTCYTITPDTYQWYRINTNKITSSQIIALCHDPTVHMLPLPPAESLQVYAFETSVSLTYAETPLWSV